MSAHDAMGRQFFHTTRAELKPGERLKTSVELHGEESTQDEKGLYYGDHAWRASRVWMHDQPVVSPYTGAGHVYEVEPSHDVELHVSAKHDDSMDYHPDDPEYVPQYHASSARVVRRVR